MSPCLLALYAARSAIPVSPATDATFTMDPAHCPNITGPNFRQRRNGPVRLMSRTRRHCCGDVSTADAIILIPALLTMTSTRPYRSSTRSAIASTSFSFETSASTCMTSEPSFRAAFSVSSAALKSFSTTVYPFSASTSAVRRPIPRAEPVIIATGFAFSWLIGFLSYRLGVDGWSMGSLSHGSAFKEP